MVYDDCGKSWIVRILDDFQGETVLLPLDPLPRTPTLFYSLPPPSTPSSSSFCFLEIIVEARKGRIHILDPTETDPGGARSRDPYPDSSCKITRVRALERRRVYSRKIALACTSARELVCASAALILVLVHALRYI